MMRRHLASLALGFGLAAAAGGSAFAQAGGGSTDGHTFDLSVALTGAYDDDIPGELQNTLDPTGLEVGGVSTMMTGSGRYGWRRRSVQLSGSASSAVRHYAELDRVRALSHSGALGASAQLPGRLELQLNQAANYSPSYLHTLFPDLDEGLAADTASVAPDYTAAESASTSYSTTAGLARALGRRTRLSVTGDVTHTDFTRGGERRDVSVYGIRADFARSLSRNVSFLGGYRYRAGEYIYGDVTTEDDPTPEWQTSGDHAVDFGFSISRPLSATRRAVFSFAAGASTLRAPTEDRQGFYDGYRLTGHAEAAYQFGRSWQVRGALNRGTEYVAELGEPVLLGGLALSIGGELAANTTFVASAQYSRGESALRQDTLDFDTYAANMRVSQSLSARFGVYGEYLYYYYDFGRAPVAATFPSSLERSGVRVGLTVLLSSRR